MVVDWKRVNCRVGWLRHFDGMEQECRGEREFIMMVMVTVMVMFGDGEVGSVGREVFGEVHSSFGAER